MISEQPVYVATVFSPYTDYLFALEKALYATEGQTYTADFFVYQDCLKKFEILDLGNQVNMEALLAAEPDVFITFLHPSF